MSVVDKQQAQTKRGAHARVQPASSIVNQITQTLMISTPKVAGLNEDFLACRMSNTCAMAAVFDGCGGAGGRKYVEFNNRTGAYIASRAAAEGAEECFERLWIHKKTNPMQLEARQTSKGFSKDFKECIDAKLKLCQSRTCSYSSLKGNLQKEFPTTIAICLAYLDTQSGDVVANVLWAGDSRCYWLDAFGLHQLTEDDVNVTDAMSNIHEDAAMTNVASAAVSYKLHEKRWTGFGRGMLFAATDGCFGYFPSPMHFESILLSTLVSASSIDDWQQRLLRILSAASGDDATLSAILLGFDSFETTRSYFLNRRAYVKERYIDPCERDASFIQQLWEEYAPEYSVCLECRHG